MATFSRQEVLAAFDAFLEMQKRDDWEATVYTFTEDGVYYDPHWGWMVGRDKIRDWLISAMEPCKGWTYPERWRVIEGNQIAYGWYNRLPGKRSDDSFYEFLGMSRKVYAGDGLFSYHEDLYNWESCTEVVAEWQQAHGG